MPMTDASHPWASRRGLVVPDTERVDLDDDLMTRNPLDVIATIFGLLILVFAVWGLAAASVVLGMASDPCGAPTVVCDYGFFTAGESIAMYGVIAVGVIGIVMAILRVRAGRSAWWIPPLAILVAVGAVLLGGEVATLGVQPGPGPEWEPTDRPAQL